MSGPKFANVVDLANNYTSDQLIYALAMQACQTARDMMSDFIRDPTYREEAGFPTRDTLIQDACEFAMHSRPEMFIDDLGDGRRYYPRGTDDTLWEETMRVAVHQIFEGYPQLMQITVDLS